MKLRLKALLGVVLLAAGPAYAADPLAAAGKAVAAGDYAAALTDLKQLQGAQADGVTARFLRGTALAGSGQLKQAAVVLRKLIADHPRLPEPYNNLAAIYVREGRLAEAKSVLERGLRTDERYAALYRNLGDVYVQMARASYAKALRIKSANPPPALQVLTSVRTTPRAKAPITVASAAPVLPPAAPAKAAVPVAKPKPAAKPAAEPTLKPNPVSRPAPKPEPRPTVVAVAAPAPKPAPVVVKPKPAPAVSKPTVAPATPAPAAKPAPAAVPASQPAQVSTPPVAAPVPPPSARVATAAGDQAKAAAAERQSVIDTLQGWATAWSQQNVSSYLDYYAVDYAPPGTNHSAWAAERRERLTRPAWIKVALTDIQVQVKTPTRAEVTLVQHYTASDYRDVTSKGFTLVMREGNWMITAERSLKALH